MRGVGGSQADKHRLEKKKKEEEQMTKVSDIQTSIG